MGGWTGIGKDTIAWDGCLIADCFEGDGSKLSGISATTPAGFDTWVQYNNSGAFGADAGFTTNKGGSIDLSGTVSSVIGSFGTMTDGTAVLQSGSLTAVKLGTLTSNGLVQTSGGDGTLSVNTDNQVIGTGASGQVAIWTETDEVLGSDELYWDFTNNRLGIGVVAPSAKLHVAIDDLTFQNVSRNLMYTSFDTTYPAAQAVTATTNTYLMKYLASPDGTISTDNFFGAGYNFYGADIRIQPAITVTGGADSISMTNTGINGQVSNTSSFADSNAFNSQAHTDRGLLFSALSYQTFNIAGETIIVTTEGLKAVGQGNVTETAGTVTNGITGANVQGTEVGTSTATNVNVKGINVTATSNRGSSPAVISGIWLNDVTGGTTNRGIVIDSDAVGLTLGQGQDTLTKYDGTDLSINSSVVGSGTLRLDSANNWTANGTANVTISNVAPAGVGTATISKWLTIKDNAGTVYYIPAWT